MEKTVVTGAGLVGSLQAIYLAKRGYNVEVYEKRPDMRNAEVEAGRSINLALSDRGWKALEGAGVAKKVKEMAIPMYGRMMHDINGNLTFQPYGKEGQAIYSVSRADLNIALINAAASYPSVKFFFNEKCEDLDIDKNELQFFNYESKTRSKVGADRIFGTDGAFSAVRTQLQKTDRFNYSQYFLKHGYKELVIPANSNGSHKLDKNALHIWPRGEFMLIALANLDGSFTVTLFLPFEGKQSFQSLQKENDVTRFFEEVFPDALPLMPTLQNDFFENPTSSLVTIKCDPWNYQDKVLLLGDAAHAVVPFYGQGMNSGFEDCTILEEVMKKHNGNWNKVFIEFSRKRKPDADAIADLALHNFIEMRDKVADPDFLLQKKIEKKIFEKYPDKWMPLYSRVTFSHRPYSEALETGRKQERIMQQIMNMENIDQNWDSSEIENKILSLLENNS